jgi:hypothetical protein
MKNRGQELRREIYHKNQHENNAEKNNGISEFTIIHAIKIGDPAIVVQEDEESNLYEYLINVQSQILR